MSHARVACRRPLLFVGLVLGLMWATAGVAQASFGEITRFGEPGKQTIEKFEITTEAGKLTPTVYKESGVGAVELEFSPWHAIGVEPKTNDVYVLEEYKPPKETENEKVERFLRVQELNDKGEFLGDFEFTLKLPEENYEEENGIEGIAVDAERGRLYFLVNEKRGEEVPQEEESVAASLYAFKTTPNGAKELEPASGANPTTGVLAGPEKLDPTSNTPGVALLQPRGITVDPHTGEVIILAHNDECVVAGEEECLNEELQSPAEHYVSQRVNGETGKLEARFVDTGNVLKTQSGTVGFQAPTSPVVAGSGASEHLLANGLLEQEPPGGPATEEKVIDEFPASISGTPTIFKLPDLGSAEAGPAVEHGFAEDGNGGGGIDEETGGTLVVSPEGTTLEGLSFIENEEGEKNEELDGISERSATTLAPIGWTGGQRFNSTGKDKCVLEPGPKAGEHIQVAAGSGGDVFVLVPEYLAVWPAKRQPQQSTRDAIIEFGPGGTGCPEAKAEKNVVVVNGKETTQPVATDVPVTLSSFVKEGDALSVKWKLENETTHATSEETQSTDQYQKPALVHTFTAPAKYKITEEITTDNLDTPKLTVSRSLEVEEKTEAPEIITQPKSAKVLVGETAKFTAAATGKPTPTPQWFVSTDKGVEFKEDKSEVTGDKGTKGNTLEVAATAAKNGYEYYVEYSGAGKVASAHVKLEVTAKAPTVTKSPSSATVTAGENASFTAAAEGAPAPTVQWEASSNGGAFTPIAGATSDTYTVSGTTTSESGNQYRAVFTNEAGSKESAVATLTVNAPPPPPPPPPTPTPTPTPTPPGEIGVQPSHVHSPTAVIASASPASVSSSGAVSLKVSCPAGASTCIGTVTLRTLTAVSASAHAAKSKKKAILTLATGSFSVAGGQAETITLHLSGTARTLLAHLHTLASRATVAAHDPEGEQQTTTKVLTLHAAKRR